ncbi:MAG: ABC transporter substrate-binding protein [Xanthobacteraceae bacterium]
MRRRAFITLLGGAAAAWSVPGHAQQAARTIGYISSRSRQADAHLVAAFRHGLGEIGYVEGQNVAIEFRWAEGDYGNHEALTTDLVQRQVDVIVATSAPTAIAAKKVPRRAIPLVFTSGQDPVKDGLVASFDRPGGDATGIYVFTAELGPKRLQILRELVPGAAVIGFLINPNVVTAEFQRKEVQAAARAMGQQLEIFTASSESEINLAFDTMARSKIGALLLGADPLFQVWRPQLIDLAVRHRIPAMYEWAEFVTSGGLASYSTNRAEAYRLAGNYAGRILKGEKPAELPVVLSAKFELVINNTTARMLGLTVPSSLLAIADQVIE